MTLSKYILGYSQILIDINREKITQVHVNPHVILWPMVYVTLHSKILIAF